MLRKTNFREIKNSLGRYLSILLIVALGVGFFCGLKVTTPAIVKSADAFYNTQNLYDYEYISTLGYETVDVKRASELNGVKYAEGTVTADVLVEGEDSDIVLKAMTTSDRINIPSLISGRMPEEPDECLADSRMYGSDCIGDMIIISEANDEDTKEMFSYGKYEIVGTCVSPIYANYERGSTSIGNGTINAYMYLMPEGFDTDYFTEIYIDLDENYPIYSDEYDEYIDSMDTFLTDSGEALSYARFNRIKNEAGDKLSDAEKEYSDGYEEYADEKRKAYDELSDAYLKLKDGEKEISDGENELLENERKIEKNEKKIDDGEKKASKNEKKLNKALEEIEDGKAQLSEKKNNLLQNKAQVEDGIRQIEEALLQLEAGKEYMDEDSYQAQYDYLTSQKSGLENNLKDINDGLEKISSGEKEIDENEEKILSGLSSIATSKKEIAEARTEIEKGKTEIEKGWKELDEAKAELKDGWKEYYDGKAKADREFAKAEKELADARVKISDARKEIDDIDYPKTYVLNRSANVAYVCFENDSDIVDQVARLFPIFFFLVAALVCMTTMTRMIDENRTQIGVMKALGYRPSQVMSKYVFYAGSAGIIGSITGFFLCCVLFPLVIWKAYLMMYEFSCELHYVFDLKLGLLSLLAAIICTVGTTVVCGFKDFRETPAQLIRPKAPAAGKKILLERWTGLWKRLSFLYKVSIRNIFRYKKRFFMMVAGIAGCTALLLTGLGAGDSIGSVASNQYDRILHYDYSVYFEDDSALNDKTEFEKILSKDGASMIFVDEAAVTYDSKGITKEFTLVVSDGEDFGKYISLYNDDGEIAYPEDGCAVLCENAANRNGIKIGDKITVLDENDNEIIVRITDLCKNYIGSYLYINEETYRESMDKKASLNTAYVMADGDVHESAAKAWDFDCVAGTTVNQDMRERIFSLIGNLDAVILLVIAAAGALCFIVLYNLTNINIRERIREIATLKVLGFYAKETASYVFRENIIMTAISAAAGLLLGKLLHAVIISMLKVDFIYFEIKIDPSSYIIAVLLTFVFAIIVNAVMYFKLEKISMTESLKTVE